MPKTVRVDDFAEGRLLQLQRALLRDFGVRASRDAIVSALAYWTNAPQAVGMLAAYNQRAERAGQDPAADDQPAASE